MSEPIYIILNGKLVEEQEAKISPANRGMMYGDGCFETIRYYAGSFLRWNRHYQRLKGGLEYLGINPAFTADELMEQVLSLLEANQLAEKESMVRIQCWREGGRGYAADSISMNWMIQAVVIVSGASPLKLTVAETRCIPSVALQRKYKLSNGLNYIKAAQEASRRQCNDSLMLTMHAKISETTSANIFWVKENEVYTPDDDCDLLPGVTRRIVMEVVSSLGIVLIKGKFNLSEIREAEAVFVTNSLVEIKEILSLDDLIFEMKHPLVTKIKEGFERYKVQELKI
ncbi:MAG: aminotransferase class IV [Gracilimonas sp.]|uniref:aminotransferase class IV n=1 Tax=Gracilimonas sp. TaxID=1974203 RepID=UPI0037512DDC|nr:aminotransferase class IV [Gracilimonas sp.]